MSTFCSSNPEIQIDIEKTGSIGYQEWRTHIDEVNSQYLDLLEIIVISNYGGRRNSRPSTTWIYDRIRERRLREDFYFQLIIAGIMILIGVVIYQIYENGLGRTK